MNHPRLGLCSARFLAKILESAIGEGKILQLKMNPLKSLTITCLFICLINISSPLDAGTDSSFELYALPAKELETVVREWLSRFGFEAQRAKLDADGVRLTITRPAEKWQITIRPQTPSTTEFRASAVTNALKRDVTARQMAAYIAEYIRKSSGKEEVSNQSIPPAVLSQIDAAVCLSTRSKTKSSQQTGFVVDTQGLVLTTIHDVETFHDIAVTLYDGRELDGEVIKKNIDQDLALINIRAGLENAVSLAKGRNLLGMGERVYAVGCPIGLGGSVFAGIINGPPRRVGKLTYWQVNMEIHQGSSGSPVFDVQGNLVGVVKGRYRGTQTIGFLIPLETIAAFVKGP
jgi:serine protease Do